VVERFLAEHQEFELDPSVEVLPENGRLLIKKGYLKTFPPPDEMDGFFVARLKKKS